MDIVAFNNLRNTDRVRLIEDALIRETNPANVFGDAAKAKKVYRKLSKLVHVDTGAPDSDAMTLLNILWDNAENQIANGSYGYDLPVAGVEMIIAGNRVMVYEKLRETEVSSVYYGEIDGVPVCVDIAHIGNSDLLDAAAQNMKLIATLNVQESFFYPTLICEGVDGKRSKVNVYQYTMPDGNVLDPRKTASLKQVVEGVGGTLRDKHIAWIWRKLLMAIGIMWHYGVIHAGLNPDNIIVTTDLELHGVIMDGWYFASYQQTPIMVVNDAWLDIYPSKIKDTERQHPLPGLDVYMGAKSMMWANKTLNQVFVDYFNWCAQDYVLARPDKVQVMLPEFDHRIFNVLGWQREFVRMTEYAPRNSDHGIDWSWFW